MSPKEFGKWRASVLDPTMFARRHRADSLKFFFSSEFFRFTKEGAIMLVSLTPGQVATAVISPTAKGNPSNATLSLITFGSSDPTVFTVVPDPAVPNGCIITGVGNGTATDAKITATATATEADGKTTEQIQGSDDISCSLVTVATPPADAIVFTLTSSTPVPPPVPISSSSLFGAKK